MYFYEGRTARGLRWMAIALGAQLIATAAIGAFLLTVAVALGPVVRQPQLPEPYMLLAMSAGLSYVLAQVLIGILFVLGFAALYTGAREFGPRHEARLEWSLVLFIVTIVAVFASYSIPATGLTSTPSFVSPSPSLVQAFLGPFLGGLGALLAGITLFLSVRGLADSARRRRMGLAIILGVTGGAGQQFLTLLGALSPSSPDSVPLTVMAVAIVGYGVSTVSLALFLLAYRDVRRGIEAGAVPPSLPRAPERSPKGMPANPSSPPTPPISPPQ